MAADLSLRVLVVLVLVTGLSACRCSEPTPEPDATLPQPPEVTKAARDTGAKPTADEEEARRREYFKAIERGETPPVVPAPAPAPVADATQPAPAPAPVVVAPAPAPAPVAVAPKPAPVAPKPAPIAPKPAPAPVVVAPKPAPAPAPVAVAPAPAIVAPAPQPAPVVPTPDPTPVAETPAPPETEGDAVAMAAVEPVSIPRDDAASLRLTVDPVVRCGDPAELDEAARKGALSNADIACLNEAYGLSTSRLAWERVSVMLLSNAYAARDTASQATLLARHLGEIDSENPEMAYRYALLLMQRGPERAADVVRWSNVALINRAAWTGETYQQRVYALYKLRAAASLTVLKDAERAQSEGYGDELERAVVRAREDTKRYSREWYVYARDTGQDVQAALDLCLIASQSASWCMGS